MRDVSADQTAYTGHVLQDRDDDPAGGGPTAGSPLLRFTVLSPSVDNSAVNPPLHPNWELGAETEASKQFDLLRLAAQRTD